MLAVVTPLGFLAKLYSGPVPSWISTHLGGLLYVVFWIFVVLLAFPRVSPLRASVAVLLVTSALELLQLWDAGFLRPIRSTFWGHAFLGSTFAWSDFPFYAAGALIAYWGARLIRRS